MHKYFKFIIKFSLRYSLHTLTPSFSNFRNSFSRNSHLRFVISMKFYLMNTSFHTHTHTHIYTYTIHRLLAYRHLLLGHVSNAASAARNRDPLPVVPATSIEHVSPRVPVGFFERVWRASNALSNPSISPGQLYVLLSWQKSSSIFG